MRRERRAGASGRPAFEAPAGSPVRGEILRFLDDTFGRGNWGHTGLQAAIRALGVEEAGWRPFDAAHSVWEQINHIAHWKRYVMRRARGLRPRSYQAWPAAARTVADLRRAQSGLESLHRDLRRVVLRLGPGEFQEKKGGRYPLVQLLLASAAHESYHIGQILLTRKLYRRRRRERRHPGPQATRAGASGSSTRRRP